MQGSGCQHTLLPSSTFAGKAGRAQHVLQAGEHPKRAEGEASQKSYVPGPDWVAARRLQNLHKNATCGVMAFLS